MKFSFNKSKELLKADGREIHAWSRVRNELNGQRGPKEIVMTEPDEHPYYPRTFPVGIWQMLKPIAHPDQAKDGYLYPWFLPTDAWQDVDVWAVRNGVYYKKTGTKYRDSGYGFHFSTSGTTLGCGRIEKLEDLQWLASLVTSVLAKREKIFVEVTE